jgi:hypothetical protein
VERERESGKESADSNASVWVPSEKEEAGGVEGGRAERHSGAVRHES